jgi:hypothetical protein
MKILAAAAVALTVAGCAHAPIMKQPQVNKAAKADKLIKQAEPQTPNQAVKKRWMPKFKIKWLHSK